MTAKEYIESGAIEAYAAGLADEDDVRIQLEMESLYPEVKAARLSMELDMEQADMANAIIPPEMMRQKVKEAVDALAAEEFPAGVASISPGAKPATPVVSITAAPKPVRWLRGALAASVLLLMGSILLNFYFYSKFAGKRREYNALLVSQNSLLATNARMQEEMRMVMSPDMLAVSMPAVPNRGNALCMVYWDKRTRDVYLRVNQLPKPESGKQYQLWAIVDGKPVDAGVLNMGDESLLHKMKNMPRADAFAITLEKEGGSEVPTLSEMYVMGSV